MSEGIPVRDYLADQLAGDLLRIAAEHDAENIDWSVAERCRLSARAAYGLDVTSSSKSEEN